MYQAYLKWVWIVIGSMMIFPVLAQELIFEEDFAEGFPAGWESIDLNGTTGKWEYCPIHNPNIGSCPEIWIGDPNLQGPLATTSADNGFMHFDSDKFDDSFPNKDHNAYLRTKAYNFSKNNQVWLKFDYHIGVFTYGTKDRALVEVSTDNINWSIFNFVDIITGNTPEPGLITWSKNPSLAIIDISAIAAKEENVYIRWRWESRFEFFFAIDDVHFYDEDPAPLYFDSQDLEMASFYAIYPNFYTPRSQTESFSFLGDFYNRGWQTVENINFKGTIFKDDIPIFSDSVQIDSIEKFSLLENIPFPNSYDDFSEKGAYEGEYSVEGAVKDPTLNNQRFFDFRISDSLFAKAENIDGHLSPAEESFQGFPHAWEFGNYYHLPNGEGEMAKGLSFSVAPASGKTMLDYQGIEMIIKLQNWSDENADGLAQSTELTLFGATPYIMTGIEQQFSHIYVEFLKEIPLIDGSYLATVKFSPANGVADIRMGVGRFLKYGGMIAQTQLSGNPRYASVLQLNGPNDPPYSTDAFGFDLISSVRLHLKKNTVRTKQAPESRQLLVYPNPNFGEFWVNRGTTVELPSTFSLYDQLGKLVYQEEKSGCQVCKLRLPSLPSGRYMLVSSNAKEQTINTIQLLTNGH